MSRVAVRAVSSAAEAALFLRVPSLLGGAAAGWGVPLVWEARRVFDPAFNRFHEDHATARFLALRDGRPVGRIAACQPLAGPGPATFGFLAVERDAATLRALLDAALGWLAARGAAEALGPLSFTINHEVGAQAGFFDRPPMLRMPRNPGWLPGMLDAAGLTPVQDVLACTLDIAREAHRARFAALVARRPTEMARLTLRRASRLHRGRETALLARLYDDGWAENWGAVPLRPGEVEGYARLLRPLDVAGVLLFASWDGVPMGLCALLPNLEEATAGLDGRLLPFGWARLLPALLGRVGSARIPLLGTTRAFRGHPASALAIGALLAEAIDVAERRGWRRVEISWILEGNAAMRNTMARLPAPVDGRWRIWRARTAR